MSDEMSVEMSPTVGELFKAVSEMQAELEGAKKSAVNPHLKNKYADLADVIAASKAVLAKHKLCVIQTTRNVGDAGPLVVTTLGHASGEWMRGELFLPAAKKDPQGFGSAITYARRYGHSAIVGIAPEDDDGNAASGTPKQEHGPIKQKPQDLTGQLAASVDGGTLLAALHKKLASATTMGELNEAWLAVNAAAPQMQKSSVVELEKLKNARKNALRPAAAE